jgi:hypothetical protein
MIHAYLDHADSVTAAKPQHGHRKTNMIVEIALGFRT